MSHNDTDDATIAAPDSQSLGSMIDEYFDLREDYRELAQDLDALKRTMEQIENQIIEALDAQDLGLGRGRRASANITESEVPVIEDIDAFQEYILKHQALHLLERRPAVGAWRELRDGGEEVPGIQPLTRRKLSVRKIQR